MRFTKTQAFEHRARQKMQGEPDLDDKFAVIKILREKFGIHGLTGEILMITEDSYRCPDIFVKQRKPSIVIELDGEVHGNGEPVTKRPRDEARDADYHRIGVQLIIINKQQTERYKTAKVIKVLQESGLQLI